MNIINASKGIPAVFDSGQFNLTKWKDYADKWVPGAKNICLNDMRDCINGGFSWENDYLPVLNSVMKDSMKRDGALESFLKITEHLDDRIVEVFGKTIDVDVVLYLGLCNGAGWVTKINGKTTVLLGIEKIMELDWCDTDSMIGLIVHELGHVYHYQYGARQFKIDYLPDKFLWQLFEEGVAMVFEQEIIGNTEYFHQDKNAWKSWCDQNAELIKHSFYNDIKSMTRENQRYFGDWVSFEGHGDTGYYLGVLFLRFLMRSESFDGIIQYGIREVKEGYNRFMLSSR